MRNDGRVDRTVETDVASSGTWLGALVPGIAVLMVLALAVHFVTVLVSGSDVMQLLEKENWGEQLESEWKDGCLYAIGSRETEMTYAGASGAEYTAVYISGAYFSLTETMDWLDSKVVSSGNGVQAMIGTFWNFVSGAVEEIATYVGNIGAQVAFEWFVQLSQWWNSLFG